MHAFVSLSDFDMGVRELISIGYFRNFLIDDSSSMEVKRSWWWQTHPEFCNGSRMVALILSIDPFIVI